MVTKLLLLGSSVVFVGCGAGGAGSDGSLGSGSLGNIASVAGTAVTDEATNALAEGTSSPSGLVNSAAADRDFTVTKTCTPDKPATGNVEVKWSRSGTGSKTITKGKWEITHAITASGSEIRDWVAPTGTNLTCNQANTGVRVNWSGSNGVDGLRMTATVDRIHAISVTKKRSTGATVSATHDSATKGTRTVTWGTPTVTSSTISLQKSIVLDLTSVSTVSTESGTSVTSSGTIKTDGAGPLSVAIVRSGSSSITPTIQSKTIQSGTIIHTDTSGPVTSTTFSSVKYDLTSANSAKCVPVSGTITGKVYSSAADMTSGSASKTFVINFNDSSVDSGISISYDGAVAQDYQYSMEGCDLAKES